MQQLKNPVRVLKAQFNNVFAAFTCFAALAVILRFCFFGLSSACARAL